MGRTLQKGALEPHCRNQQPKGTRRARGMSLAPERISGCDGEVTKARWVVWGKWHRLITCERRLTLLILWYLLCHKKGPFFSASTPAFLLWKISDQNHEAPKTHVAHPDGQGPEHCLLLDTQINPGNQNSWAVEGISALIQNSEATWSHPWLWHETTFSSRLSCAGALRQLSKSPESPGCTASAYFIALLKKLKELIYVGHLTRCTAPKTCLINVG